MRVVNTKVLLLLSTLLMWWWRQLVRPLCCREAASSSRHQHQCKHMETSVPVQWLGYQQPTQGKVFWLYPRVIILRGGFLFVKRILIFVIFVICESEVGLLVHKLSSLITNSRDNLLMSTLVLGGENLCKCQSLSKETHSNDFLWVLLLNTEGKL